MFEQEYRQGMEKLSASAQWRTDTLQKMQQARQASSAPGQPAPAPGKRPLRVSPRAALLCAAAVVALLVVPLGQWQGLWTGASTATLSEADAAPARVMTAEDTAGADTDDPRMAIAPQADMPTQESAEAAPEQATGGTGAAAEDVPLWQQGVLEELTDTGFYLREGTERTYYAITAQTDWGGASAQALEDCTVTVVYTQDADGLRTAVQVRADF